MSFMADTIFIRTLGADGTYDIKGLTTLAVVILVILLLILAPTILKGIGLAADAQKDKEKFIAYNFDPSAQRMYQTGSSFAGLAGVKGSQGFLGVPEAPNFSGSGPDGSNLMDTGITGKNSTGLGPLGELAAADAAAAKSSQKFAHGDAHYAQKAGMYSSAAQNARI